MTNLSTSSSDPGSDQKDRDRNVGAKLPSTSNRWYRSFWDIIGTVAALGLIELAVHVGVTKFNLFEQDEGLTQRSDFVANAAVRAERGKPTDVAIIGSSIADGIDTEKLSQELGNDSLVESYRLVGADSKGTAQMLDTIVFPNLKVKWVVYVVSSHDTNGLSVIGKRNEHIQSLDAYADNRTTYKISRWIETNVYLYRYRQGIKSALPTPFKVEQWLTGQKNQASSAAAKKPYEFAAYSEFKEADRFEPDLEYIYRLCEQNGARLVILTLPTNPAATSEEFQQETDRWVRSVKDFAGERNIDFINGLEFISTENQFRDTHHLSKAGIAPATEALRKTIARHNLK